MKDELLNLYLDGRLAPDDVRRVDLALEQHADVRRRFEALLEAREAVQAAFAVPADLPDFDEVWSGVESRLAIEAERAAAPSRVEAWWAWLFRPAFAMAAGAALVAAIVAGVWLAGSPESGAPTTPGAEPRLAANAPAEVPAEIPAVVAGARRELPVEGARRGMVGEEKAPRYLAVVESYDVERGVVVVTRTEGSKYPVVIWHLVPGEEIDDEGGEMP